MTDEELFDKTKEFNLLLTEYGMRKALHRRLEYTDMTDRSLLEKLDLLLFDLQTEIDNRRQQSLAEEA